MMNSYFSASIPFTQPVYRADVASCCEAMQATLFDLCGCAQETMGGGIHLFCDRQNIRFDTVAEMTEHFPPLDPILGFHLSTTFRPFSPDELGLSAFMARGSSKIDISAMAPSAVLAQELVLRLGQHLQALCKPPENADRQKEKPVDNKPDNPPEKSPVTFMKAVNTVFDLIAKLPTVFGVVSKFFRFLLSLVFRP